MNASIRLGGWNELQADARPIRYSVFVVEQKVPEELEWDDMDAACLHAVAYGSDGGALATGRLLPDGHIGRMAVLPHARGKRLGGAILEMLMAEAKARGDGSVMLNAQTSAEAFYRRYGFVREGEEFIEAGIPHIAMRHVFTI